MPRVVIGVPLYNGGEHLAEALESLLAQTYSDFDLVLVDDCSTDATEDLARGFAKEDARVHFRRNEHRLGLVGNWRRTFELAKELHPDLDYFAWGSDHDVWHPRWLELLLPELDMHPEAVLAYPRTARIGENGELRRRGSETFDTAEVDQPRRRAELTWRAGDFGYRVYGLFRTRALARCGVFRYVFLPDRLLLFELALQGRFREVPEVLWYRRRPGFSFERQRHAFFPNRRAPLWFRMKWFYPHGAILFWSLAVRGSARPAVTRREGAAVAVRYPKLGRDFLRRRERELREKLAETEDRLSRAMRKREALQRAHDLAQQLTESGGPINKRRARRELPKLEQKLSAANERRDKLLERSDELTRKLQERQRV